MIQKERHPHRLSSPAYSSENKHRLFRTPLARLAPPLFCVLLLVLLYVFGVSALLNGNASEGHGGAAAMTFLWIVTILVAAKFSALVERIGLPSVLGELIIGVILGNLILFGFPYLEPIKHDEIILFLAELGVVILLFQIGLESNIKEILKNGTKALSVALGGVVVPFALTMLLSPVLLPGISLHAQLFLAAILTATSVGITARVFKDLGKLQTKEARIVLAAAVIDDIAGLILIAVLSSLVVAGTVSVGLVSWTIAKAVLFLFGAIVIGHFSAHQLGKILAKIQSGVGTKLTLAICFCLFFASLAHVIGLAPIIGAFAAGLVLDPVHFRYFKDPLVVFDVKDAIAQADAKLKENMTKIMERHSDRHVEDIIEPIGHLLVPIFFVMTGMMVKLDTLFDPTVLLTGLGITAIAIIGKVSAGFFAGRGMNRLLIGWAMVPRGEVALIFATVGLQLGVVTDKIFSIVIIMVIITTLMSPLVLARLLKE